MTATANGAGDRLTKDVGSDAEADAWLGWVDRHYGLARSSITTTAKGLRVTAYLKADEHAGGEAPSCPWESSLPDHVDQLVATRLADEESAELEAQLATLASIADARVVLERYEDAELLRLSERTSLRTLASASKVSPEAVRKRLRRDNVRRRRR